MNTEDDVFDSDDSYESFDPDGSIIKLIYGAIFWLFLLMLTWAIYYVIYSDGYGVHMNYSSFMAWLDIHVCFISIWFFTRFIIIFLAQALEENKLHKKKANHLKTVVAIFEE